jgi:hypothetical protein
VIHHISFPANDPRHVADVLAELMDGRTYPFPGVPGSFIAVSGDPHGTAIEVHPADWLLAPSGSQRQPNQPAPHRGAFHMFLSVPLSREQVEAIGRREGWTTQFCGRPSEALLAPGQKPFFQLIEVWVEDHFLIEVVPQNYISDYEALFQFEVLDRIVPAFPG